MRSLFPLPRAAGRKPGWGGLAGARRWLGAAFPRGLGGSRRGTELRYARPWPLERRPMEHPRAPSVHFRVPSGGLSAAPLGQQDVFIYPDLVRPDRIVGAPQDCRVHLPSNHRLHQVHARPYEGQNG
jgi:hypothetical protein